MTGFAVHSSRRTWSPTGVGCLLLQFPAESTWRRPGWLSPSCWLRNLGHIKKEIQGRRDRRVVGRFRCQGRRDGQEDSSCSWVDGAAAMEVMFKMYIEGHMPEVHRPILFRQTTLKYRRLNENKTEQNEQTKAELLQHSM